MPSPFWTPCFLGVSPLPTSSLNFSPLFSTPSEYPHLNAHGHLKHAPTFLHIPCTPHPFLFSWGRCFHREDLLFLTNSMLLARDYPRLKPECLPFLHWEDLSRKLTHHVKPIECALFNLFFIFYCELLTFTRNLSMEIL